MQRHPFLNHYVDERVAEAARKYEAEFVIPHCVKCSRPCCRLTDVVLELDWGRLARLYQLSQSRREFDNALRKGQGPCFIREQDGQYYVYGKECPAYDEQSKQCRVYATSIKPESCTDYPVYLDGNAISADTRCEAVNTGELLKRLRAAAPDLNLIAKHGRDSPSIISIFPRKKRMR